MFVKCVRAGKNKAKDYWIIFELFPFLLYLYVSIRNLHIQTEKIIFQMQLLCIVIQN